MWGISRRRPVRFFPFPGKCLQGVFLVIGCVQGTSPSLVFFGELEGSLVVSRLLTLRFAGTLPRGQLFPSCGASPGLSPVHAFFFPNPPPRATLLSTGMIAGQSFFPLPPGPNIEPFHEKGFLSSVFCQCPLVYPLPLCDTTFAEWSLPVAAQGCQIWRSGIVTSFPLHPIGRAVLRVELCWMPRHVGQPRDMCILSVENQRHTLLLPFSTLTPSHLLLGSDRRFALAEVFERSSPPSWSCSLRCPPLRFCFSFPLMDT